MNALSIITIILAVLGLAATFWKQYVAAILSYVAIVLACINNVNERMAVSHDALLFWGISTVIVICLRVLNSESPALTRQAVFFCTLGAIAGSVVGMAMYSTSASIIIGAAVGAALGAFVFTRTRAGVVIRQTPRGYVDYLCAIGLPVVVSVAMSEISIAASIPY